MKTVKKYLGYNGKELLSMVNDTGECVSLNKDVNALLTPMAMTFSNRGEIATKEDATHVSVRTVWGDHYMVKI